MLSWLRFGANVFMPLITPPTYRKDYRLYDGKPCIDELADDCDECAVNRMVSIGREIGYDEWGDSLHFKKLKAKGFRSLRDIGHYLI